MQRFKSPGPHSTIHCVCCYIIITIVLLPDQIKTYKTYNYSPLKLGNYIAGITLYQFTDDSPVMLNPGGYFELIFQLEGSFVQSVVLQDSWQIRPDFFVGGLHSRSFMVKPDKAGAKLLSIQFRPNCARFFIPDRLNLFKNKIEDLESVFKTRFLSRFHEGFSQLKMLEVIRKIESFLISVYREKPMSPIDIAVGDIYQKHGFVNIDQLAQKSYLSPSHLRKRFNEEVGMSPKEYSKIVRINYISGILSQSTAVHLTELTYQLGYFDQAHFINDFKSVTGVSPGRFNQ